MTEYRIHIPHWHPARVNELLSGHWSKAHRRKKADRHMVWGHTRSIPPAASARRVQLTIILKPRQRGGDPDAYFKSALDAMVHAKLLADDNRQHVELLPVRYERGTDTDWGTTIYLRDL